MKRTSHYVALLLVASLVSSPLAARAEDPAPSATVDAAKLEEARERYNRGLRLYDQGNALAARIELERAYELVPSYRILYNIGLCYQASNDYVGALRTFQRYLIEGRDEISDDRHAAVNKEIQNLKPNIASITVSSREPGLAISVDDVPAGQTPLPEKILLNPGTRRITGSKSGFLPQTKSVVLAGSDNASVSFELVALPVAGANKEKESGSALPYVAWGLTGALAAGAGITGYLALRANADQNDIIDHSGATSAQVEDARDKTRTFSIAADCLVAATILTGGIALYFSLRKSDKPSSGETAARVTPGGVSIVGRF
ncbi:PEGA domain-containing protein [Pendulispora rubella]|uniref:PEGA domain-containing protein n=1 Tax=Pendulispora rubella TaxID=2741070 RepID=A0ABZ2LI30_9BACT